MSIDLQCANIESGLLTVVAILHSTDEIAAFEQTLFSLANQEYGELEVLIATDLVSEESRKLLTDLTARQPWHKSTAHRLIQLDCSGLPDRRAKLIGDGAAMAQGRFLAFVSAGDKIYQHGYLVLVNELQKSTCGVALGGIRVARIAVVDDKPHVISKTLLNQSLESKFNACVAEVIPICSFMIDRSKVSLADLRPQGLRSFEGKWLFTQLMELAEISWAQASKPVGEVEVVGEATLYPEEWKVQTDEASDISSESRLNATLSTKNCSVNVLDLKKWLDESADRIWSRCKLNLTRDNQQIDVSIVLRLLEHAAEVERMNMQTKYLKLESRYMYLQQQLDSNFLSQQTRISELKTQLSVAIERASNLEQEKIDFQAQLSGWKLSNEQLGLEVDKQARELDRRIYKFARKLALIVHKLKASLRGQSI